VILMGRRYAKKTGQRPQGERDFRIRADFNDPPDLDKLCELVIRIALRRPVPTTSSHPANCTELTSAPPQPAP
jgi:hypothetical protein